MAATRYLTLSEAADQLHTHPRTIRRWIANGDLPAYRLGAKEIRIYQDDLDCLLTRIPAGAA